MNNQPWKKNANSLLVLYSILAATCGVFIVVIFTESSPIEHCWYISLGILLLSFWLFIFSAEVITDALDENDVQKYVAAIFLYNIAVILLISGISLMIYLKFLHLNFWSFQVIIFLLVLLFMICHWLRSCCQLIFDNNEKYNSYIDSLTYRSVLAEKREWLSWTTFFLWLRRKLHGNPSNP